VTGYLTYDANVARLDDLHRRAGGRLVVRDAGALVELLSLRAGRLRAATNPRRLRLRWAYRAA
jgi:hypothetical protein